MRYAIKHSSNKTFLFISPNCNYPRVKIKARLHVKYNSFAKKISVLFYIKYETGIKKSLAAKTLLFLF